MDSTTTPPQPHNEPVLRYRSGSSERISLDAELARQSGEQTGLPAYIGGEQHYGTGTPLSVVQPHARHEVLGVMRNSTRADSEAAIDAALTAGAAWRSTPLDERCAVLLRAAELLAGPWRQKLNAATMLGQSKTTDQAEIDAACELIDFWRFNVHYAKQIYTEQPIANAPGVWNRTDHRPLEGFVYAITPFNFTAIAANLPTAPALMGSTVVWKPAPTQQLAASLTMQLLEAAGMPAGVINMLPGDGIDVSAVTLEHRDLAGIHFTGSTSTLHRLWSTVGNNIAKYRSYPRIVAETGGKDFVLVHPSADPATVTSALVRGAFEYQGQKCSAASRAYIAKSVWQAIKDDLVAETAALTVGDVRDPATFLGAVIDRRAYDKQVAAIERAHVCPHLNVLTGGKADDADGWFVQPTIVESTDPTDEMFATEYFGPILVVYVYEDGAYEDVIARIDETSPYALTGSVMARDRTAILRANDGLRFAAGNFYVNDKPTGAVVGQQPFGGGRASGTNDKAGAPSNLLRWTSPRSIKETFNPAATVSPAE